MKKSLTFIALALVAASAACGGASKDATQPPDTTVTPPPPPPPPPDTSHTNPPPPPPPPAPGPAAVVFAAGNVGRCVPNGGAEATARMIDTSAAAVFMLGNTASPRSTADNITCGYEPFWGKFKAKTYATMGNLDVTDTTTRDAGAYYAYWNDRAGPAGKGWYSFDLNGWHVVVLNTEGGTTTYNAASEQQAWLAADLSASTAKCKLAIFHRPFVYSGSAGASMNSNLGSIWAKLMAGGVDLVLVGGQYTYERMSPVNSSGVRDDANGITQFNVGMGGGVANGFGGVVNGQHPASAFVDNVNQGVLRLSLNANSADYSYRTAASPNGSDNGSIACK